MRSTFADPMNSKKPYLRSLEKTSAIEGKHLFLKSQDTIAIALGYYSAAGHVPTSRTRGPDHTHKSLLERQSQLLLAMNHLGRN
mmetsp:Transcript_31139/g.81098  ORF Transcript_31139/g.81098 Transcript_31139/m.81098 type:complete len:84 (+) Transcript_31139:1259-1510(+)|eukprot:16810-Pelagomonas_calceolata.AAC.5